MLTELLSMVRRYDMVRPGDTVTCAVSGGADSVALLFAMYLLKDKLGIRLQAAHYNHHLRGAESDADEAFVRRLCDRYEIPLTVGGSQVRAGEKGLEAAAREARYAFFETLPGKIATAHTADDNAETVLMHLVRGTGLKGLGAIAPVRGNLIRPLLLATRTQVLEFLEEYHLSCVEDSSNNTDAFLRNRLRHHVMPLLKQENPKLAQNLSAMALSLREDEQALSEDMDLSNGLEVAALRQLPMARRGRVIRAFLEYCGVREPERSHVQSCEALLLSDNPSARGEFPGGVTLCRRYDRLVLLEEERPLAPVRLQCPGVTRIPQLGMEVICDAAEQILNTPEVFTVIPEGELTVRGRLPGDTMRLPGGTKTLKKLFIDRKIPAAQRPCVPVVADRAGVLGVCGIGADLDRAASALPAVQIRFVNASDKL